LPLALLSLLPLVPILLPLLMIGALHLLQRLLGLLKLLGRMLHLLLQLLQLHLFGHLLGLPRDILGLLDSLLNSLIELSGILLPILPGLVLLTLGVRLLAGFRHGNHLLNSLPFKDL